jgi:hypothetical protein
MSEDTSLTNAVKLAAGISLTKAVKDVAGRRAWFIDEVLDAHDDAAPGTTTPRAPRLIAACARLAAFTVLTLAFLQATSTSTVLDGQRALLAAAHSAPSRSWSAIPPTVHAQAREPEERCR